MSLLTHFVFVPLAEIDSAKDKANKNACRYEYIVAQNKQG
jgi:hypothetical protein